MIGRLIDLSLRQPLLVFALLLGLTGWMVAHSRKSAVHAGNVNEDWQPDAKPGASIAANDTADLKA